MYSINVSQPEINFTRCAIPSFIYICIEITLVMTPRLCGFVSIPLPPLVVADFLKYGIPGLFLLRNQLRA